MHPHPHIDGSIIPLFWIHYTRKCTILASRMQIPDGRWPVLMCIRTRERILSCFYFYRQTHNTKISKMSRWGFPVNVTSRWEGKATPIIDTVYNVPHPFPIVVWRRLLYGQKTEAAAKSLFIGRLRLLLLYTAIPCPALHSTSVPIGTARNRSNSSVGSAASLESDSLSGWRHAALGDGFQNLAVAFCTAGRVDLREFSTWESSEGRAVNMRAKQGPTRIGG